MQPTLRTCTTPKQKTLHLTRASRSAFESADLTLCGKTIWFMPPTTNPKKLCRSCAYLLLGLPNQERE